MLLKLIRIMNQTTIDDFIINEQISVQNECGPSYQNWYDSIVIDGKLELRKWYDRDVNGKVCNRDYTLEINGLSATFGWINRLAYFIAEYFAIKRLKNLSKERHKVSEIKIRMILQQIEEELDAILDKE